MQFLRPGRSSPVRGLPERTAKPSTPRTAFILQGVWPDSGIIVPFEHCSLGIMTAVVTTKSVPTPYSTEEMSHSPREPESRRATRRDILRFARDVEGEPGLAPE